MWGRVALYGLVGSHQQSPTGGDSPLTVSPEERKHEASRRLSVCLLRDLPFDIIDTLRWGGRDGAKFSMVRV